MRQMARVRKGGAEVQNEVDEAARPSFGQLDDDIAVNAIMV